MWKEEGMNECSPKDSEVLSQIKKSPKHISFSTLEQKEDMKV